MVVPIFNEEGSIEALHAELTAVMAGLGRSFEIVYVDDGSRDGSFALLRTVAASHPSVRVVRFRRNFGQTAALQAGIDHSRGEVLVFMDGDLQNDPAAIPVLLDELDRGFDVVSGWRKDRKDPFLSRRLPSMLANSLISRVTGVRLNDYGCTLKAYRRDVLRDLRLYGEMHRFIPAYASWAGAAITEVAVNHRPRLHGRSKYGITRTLRVVLDLITVKFLGSFATKPIYVFGTVGLGLWLLGGLCAIEVLLERFLPPHTYAHNNPMLLLAVFLAILGMQSIMMGLLAEVLVRTYHESQDKPTFVIREIVDSPRSEPAPGPAPRAATARTGPR